MVDNVNIDGALIGHTSDTDLMTLADGSVTFTGSTVITTADVNGGAIDAVTLGANSAVTQAVIENVRINGSTIGHTDDTDLLTLANGVATVAGEISATTLDIGGTDVTSTAAELNILDGVTVTAAEINTLDGITAVLGELNALDLGSTAVGTAIASKAVILDSNKDYTGIRNFTITGELDAATLDISGDADIDGTTNLDIVDIDGAVDMASTLSVGGDLTVTSSANSTLNITAGGTSNDSLINFVHGSTTDGGITYDHNGAYASEQMQFRTCLLYTSPSPRDKRQSRMPSSA